MVTSFRDSVVVFFFLGVEPAVKPRVSQAGPQDGNWQLASGNLHLRQSRLERENLELREQLRAAEITSLKFSVRIRSYFFSMREAYE
jgi:hypothetical protein